MQPVKGDEEIKEGTRLKISTPNKLITRLPILLAQIKAGSSSYKLKNKIRQVLHLLHQHNKITRKVYSNLIRDPKSFCFNFKKVVDENLNHEIQFIIKSNKSLAENKIKARLNNYC